MRTPLPWYGGKSIKCRWIAPHLPVWSAYVEPCFGQGSVMLHRPACDVELANDRDGAVVNWWHALRNHTDELIHMVRFTPLAREVYAEALHLASASAQRVVRVVRQAMVGVRHRQSRRGC